MRPRALVLVGVGLSAACASGSRAVGPGAGPPSRPPNPCLIAGDSAGPPRAATVLFDDELDAAAARQAATRLAPVRLDCEGRPRPGLAESWSGDSTGRFWTLTLRPVGDAGGTEPRWTAAALAATWRSDPAAAAALRLAGVTSTVPLDDRRLVAGLASPSAGLPPVFADRSLAVGLGTGAWLQVSAPAGDLRDAVDGDADVIVTADPAALDYAAQRATLRQVALPWSRRYLLVLPRPVPGLVPTDTTGFRTALARDAVRAEARAALPGGWPDSLAQCPRAAPGPALPVADAVVYPAGDPSARELAERLVALANGEPAEARPLDPTAFSMALGRAAARAFVVRAPVQPLSPCAWTRSWPAGAAATALVDVRARAIVRRGAPPLTVEWDAALRPAEAADTLESTR